MRQKDQYELTLGTGAKGEAPSAAARDAEAHAAQACLERPAVLGPSMEAIVERENLKQALAQVTRNKGAAGVDGMTVADLPAHLKEHWPTIRAQLLDGTYKPQPVRRVEIPKVSGGTRPLGIPTVLDRFVQQAVMQVLQADLASCRGCSMPALRGRWCARLNGTWRLGHCSRSRNYSPRKRRKSSAGPLRLT
jgi:RNA-directed DNA polymerase